MKKPKAKSKNPKTRVRTFNKKRYHAKPIFQGLSKSFATGLKEKAKKRKDRARVVKQKKGYDLFLRPGTRG